MKVKISQSIYVMKLIKVSIKISKYNKSDGLKRVQNIWSNPSVSSSYSWQLKYTDKSLHKVWHFL
jgi:hypothetical protein